MKKSIQLVVLLIFLLGKTTSAQDNQILDFGKPFKMGNIFHVNGCIVRSSKFVNDYTALLIDRGKLNPNNNVLPLNCFKIVFVDLLAKQSQTVEIKDKSGNTITEAIGDPFTWIFGVDGNIYLGTQAGGHLICIDFKNRTATDLGKPINFDGIPHLTTLSLGTDLSLYGVINKTSGNNQGPYTFKYGYNYTFTQKDTMPVDQERLRAKLIGADDKYTYVRCEGSDYALYAINKLTNEKKRIILNYQDSELNPAIPLEIETYAGDYVYARISTNAGTAYYWKLYNGEVVDNEEPNKTIRRRVDCLWYHIFETSNIVTMYNNVDSKLYYQVGTIIDYVDLSNSIQKFEKPTGSIAQYTNAASSNIELFIHGQKYSYAASMKLNENNQFNLLGANSNQSTYSVIPDFDNTKVLIGSYSNGTIQQYNSAKSWNIFTSIHNPAAIDSTANPRILYQVHDPSNSINNIPGPLSASILKKINNFHLFVAGGNRGRNNPPYYDAEMAVSIINPVTSQIKNVYYEQYFHDYGFVTMGIDQTNNKIIVVGAKREAPNQASSKLFILNVNGELIGAPKELLYNGTSIINTLQIEVVNKSIFLFSDNKLFRITDYTNTNSTVELMYNLAGTGTFKSLKHITLANGKEYIVTCFLSVLENGFKFAYLPTTTTNNVAPGFDNDVIKVNGKILIEDGCNPYEMVFVNNKIYLSGFTSIYGFTPTAINNAQNGGGVNNGQKSLVIIPNPAKDIININYTASSNEKIQLQVYTNEGGILYNKELNATTGKNNFSVNISTYATGNFIVKVAAKEKTNAAKFIKE